jgi:hypothetical protein
MLLRLAYQSTKKESGESREIEQKAQGRIYVAKGFL